MADAVVRPIDGCGCLMLLAFPLAVLTLGGLAFCGLDAQGATRFALTWGCMAPLGVMGALVACFVLFFHE